MRIRNTSRYPDDEVRRLVEFGMRGVNTSRIQVNVKNFRRSYRGMAYHGVPHISPAASVPTVDRLVTIGIGSPDKFPAEAYVPYKRAPQMTFSDWREAMVAVAAHEARHIQQMQRGRSLSEVDCLRFEAKRLEEYRATL